METTAEEKDRLRTIITHLLRNNMDWFKENAINVNDKDPYWILNYSIYGKNEFNKLVRGMVVAKATSHFEDDPLSLIRSFPFKRFFNSAETEAAEVDYENSDVLEKLDGTFVGVFFPHGTIQSPEFHTRQMVSSHAPDMQLKISTFTKDKEFFFMKEIGNFVNKLSFLEEDIPFTYIFEFIHEASEVITKYQPHQYGLYLLGARNVCTHRELPEDTLDEAAVRLNSKRGRRFKATNYPKIIQMFDEIKDIKDFEGFVVRDRITGNRVKIKDPKYVEKHHLINGIASFRRLVPIVLNGEEDEVLAHFPKAKDRIDQLKNAYSNYVTQATYIVKQWHGHGLDRRSLGIKLFGPDSTVPQYVRDLVIKYHNSSDPYADINNNLRELALGNDKKAGSAKKFIQLIGLKDEEDNVQID